MDPQAFQDSHSGRIIQVPCKGYWAYCPAPLPPQLEWASDLITALSNAASALGELKGLGHHLANPHLLIAPFIRREAVLSSRIEGTHASLSDLYAYEAVQLSMFNRPTDVKEVHNYVRALEYGLERLDTFPLSLRLIRELHAHLMEGVRGDHQTPGKFRRSQNWIGPPGCLLEDATFVPPPPDQMQAALGDLEAYLHAGPALPHLVRLGLIHYQFEAIHPFLDGNGRVGRLLIVLLLCAWDLLPQPTSMARCPMTAASSPARSLARPPRWPATRRWIAMGTRRYPRRRPRHCHGWKVVSRNWTRTACCSSPAR